MAKKSSKKKQYRFNEHDENQVQVVLKKQKQKKKKKRTRRIVFLLVLMVIVAFFVSPASRIKSIKVSGNQYVDSQDILDQSKLSTSSVFPYTFVTNSIVKKRIESLPMIENAKIIYDIVGNVKIKITESDVIAWGTVKKKNYVIDRNGRVSVVKDTSSLIGTTKVSDFKKLKLFKQFAEEYVKIPVIIRNDVSDIVYFPKTKDTSRIALKLNDGKIFYMRIEDMAEQLENFDYDAYMQAYGNRCIFSFEGDNLFMKKCTSSSDDATNESTESTDSNTQQN